MSAEEDLNRKDGSVLEGPPPRPLDRYQVKVEEETVFVFGG